MDKKIREASYNGYYLLGKQDTFNTIYNLLKEKYPEAAQLVLDSNNG